MPIIEVKSKIVLVSAVALLILMGEFCLPNDLRQIDGWFMGISRRKNRNWRNSEAALIELREELNIDTTQLAWLRSALPAIV